MLPIRVFAPLTFALRLVSTEQIAAAHTACLNVGDSESKAKLGPAKSVGGGAGAGAGAASGVGAAGAGAAGAAGGRRDSVDQHSAAHGRPSSRPSGSPLPGNVPSAGSPGTAMLASGASPLPPTVPRGDRDRPGRGKSLSISVGSDAAAGPGGTGAAASAGGGEASKTPKGRSQSVFERISQPKNAQAAQTSRDERRKKEEEQKHRKSLSGVRPKSILTSGSGV